MRKQVKGLPLILFACLVVFDILTDLLDGTALAFWLLLFLPARQKLWTGEGTFGDRLKEPQTWLACLLSCALIPEVFPSLERRLSSVSGGLTLSVLVGLLVWQQFRAQKRLPALLISQRLVLLVLVMLISSTYLPYDYQDLLRMLGFGLAFIALVVWWDERGWEAEPYWLRNERELPRVRGQRT